MIKVEIVGDTARFYTSLSLFLSREAPNWVLSCSVHFFKSYVLHHTFKAMVPVFS